ncbi:hypothetical protein HOO54_20630 [Bacillus sp. WMMC1349]|uniref:hypothetical protein n=1 Tax=Bacillus sp. WMMC1349 TaxID=2736254 RepID=UPI001554D7D3|nr:hypothetical protein [Bacillus sp. WMMC1349]NPC94565.1 hypothetical protein [Bacillus sp. WMMC1349]
MHKMFNCGLILTISGFVMLFLAKLSSEALLFGVENDMNDFFGIFSWQVYIIPLVFLIIGLPFVVVISLIWFWKWSNKK